MVTVNPEQTGQYSPVQRVTAIYETREQLRTILHALHEAGFTEQEIELFIDEAGAEQLDLTGQKAGAVVQFYRELVMALSDETEIRAQLDETLRNGGMSVNVFTGDEEEKKYRAVQILKAHHPQDLRYWGHLSIECF